jgi:hypothetical protein
VPKTRLRCPCGEMITAPDEDLLVERAYAHLAAEHPALADTYSREEVLFMAY